MDLDEILQESLKIMEDDFYKKEFKFSYSSLNKLIWSPAAFFQVYVLGNKEEKMDSHLIQGKIIHCLLLEEEKFNNYFIVSPDTLPTGSTKAVLDSVYRHYIELSRNGDERTELPEFTGAILDVMKEMNYYQTLKTDQQRLDKIITSETLSYWEFLKNKGAKILIDKSDYDFCKNAVDLIKTDQAICKLIGCSVSEFDNIEVLNEILLECNINDKPFGLKGIVDNIVINHDEKIVYINDVKTSSKDLKDFPDSVEYYNYGLQAAIYSTLVGVKYANLIHNDGYTVKFNFVVIDRMYQVYPFEVSENTLTTWFNKLTHALDRAEWHYRNKRFDLPYEFANNAVRL